MRRRVFTTAAAVSTLLFVATAVLLAVGYITDGWAYQLSGEVGAFGRLGISVRRDMATVSQPWSPYDILGWRPDIDLRWHAPGFELVRVTDRPSAEHMWWVVLSLYYPLLLTAILPAIWLAGIRLRRRRWRRAHSLCVSCGYDLRASKGTCPECGAPIEVGRTVRADTDASISS